MSDSITLLGLIDSLAHLKNLRDTDILDDNEFIAIRNSILNAIKATVHRMADTGPDEEMLKFVRKRLDQQFKEDDKLYGKTPKMYRKDKD